MGFWISEVWRYREFLKNLVMKDFKVRYQGSILGFLWTLITPLATIAIYVVAFKYILRVQTENFPLFLVTGILPWTFFSTATIMATESIIGNGGLIKKIRFPREALPLSIVLFNLIHLLLALVVFFPVILYLGGVPTRALVALPLVVFFHLLFTIGVALFVGAATVFYHDIRPVTDLGLMALFWLTPIVYEIQLVPERFRFVWDWMPLTAIIRGYQDVIYAGVFPDPATWGIMIAWTAFAFLLGSGLFLAVRERFAEEL
jgi:lipopolysaccharide transport system permease protein